MELMAVFDNMLKDSESVFMDPVVLDYDYLPKMLKFRENEQHRVAFSIKPLFSGRNGKNPLSRTRAFSLSDVPMALSHSIRLVQFYQQHWYNSISDALGNWTSSVKPKSR